MKPRLGLVCAIGAVAVIAASAALLPRGYLANDDEAITDFVRGGDLAPFILPVLSQLLGGLYALAPGVPWYGLWQYAIDAAALGLCAAVLLEVVPPRRLAVLLAAPVLVGVMTVAWRPTFTTGAILACGAALIAFAAEAQRERVRMGRAIACGVLFAAGVATRPDGLLAAVAIVSPLLALTGWRLLRARAVVPARAIAALLAPAAIAIAIGPLMPQARDPEAQRWAAWNAQRGQLQGMAAFDHLPSRLLARAGWDLDHFRRMMVFLELDEGWYTSERLHALLATGGRQPHTTFAKVRAAVVEGETSAAVGTPLLGIVVLAAFALAGLGLARPRVAAFALAEAGALAALAVWLSRSMRFPTRVSLPMALLGAIVVIVAIGDGLEWTEVRARLRRRWPIVAAAALGAVLLIARATERLPELEPTRASDACNDFERRLAGRNPALVVVVYEASCSMDPLIAQPRDYPSAILGWPTFSPPWYRALARIGVSRGADLVATLATRDDAYVLANRFRLQRTLSTFQVDVPDATFEEVDASGTSSADLVLLRVHH